MIDWHQLLMTLAFGAGGALLGVAIGFALRRNTAQPGLRIALAGFVGLALAVGIGQLIFPPPGDAEQIGRELDRQAVFRMAFTREPALRDRTIERLRLAAETGGRDAYLVESEKIGMELSQRYFPDMVSRASAEALDRFLDFAVAMLEERHAHAPDACYAYLAGAAAAAGGLANLPVRLQEQADEAMAALAASADGDPVALSDAERQQAIARLSGIVADLRAGPEGQALYIADYAREPATTPESRKGACLFALRLHQAIEAVPQPERAALIRVTMGEPL
ncbi:MAG: hypothetical protein AB7O49_18225 [Sphingomonadales bacterium]